MVGERPPTMGGVLRSDVRPVVWDKITYGSMTSLDWGELAELFGILRLGGDRHRGQRGL